MGVVVVVVLYCMYCFVLNLNPGCFIFMMVPAYPGCPGKRPLNECSMYGILYGIYLQVCYVVDAFLSPYVLLSSPVSDGDGSARCIVMSLFFHYFFLAQFTAITMQVITTTIDLQKTFLLMRH